MNSRIYHTIRLWTIRSAAKRAEYMRCKHIFFSMGKACTCTPRKVPLNPMLIKIGNNVHVASNVEFATHDIAHKVLNNIGDGGTFTEKMGCIEIGDNVFVGAGTRILYNVRIGHNVIIGASSLIVKDVPDNSVVAGIPARAIGSFDDFVSKRKKESEQDSSSTEENMIEFLWDKFNATRE